MGLSQLGIMQLLEIGFFSPLWNFSIWQLSALLWFLILAAFLLQTLLLRKCAKALFRWLFIILLVAGILACECVCQNLIAYELLAALLIYGALLCCLLGAAMASAVYWRPRQDR